jgi:hypothetical protein
MAEHARACVECGSWVGDEQLLEKHLNLVRAAVPPVPPALDSAVLGNYRRYLEEQPVAIDRPGRRVRLANALPWAAALAFAALVAYGAIVFFVPHSPTGWASRQDGTTVEETPPPVTAGKQVPPSAAIPKRRQLPGRARSQGKKTEAAARGDDSVPRTFQSLVYCDQISCPGAMEVIRVELPAPVLGLEQTPARPGGVVSADVLVGADGIARGIRVVQ